MRALVTGGTGLLGMALTAVLREKGYAVSCPDRRKMEITREDQVRRVLEKEKPEVVFHCAAYTDVEKAEEERDVCKKINVEGTRILSAYCKEQQIKLVYISSDYVFPGKGNGFQKVGDPTGPLNVYGWTKLEGERAVQRMMRTYFIVRTSWIFGRGRESFPDKILRKAEEAGPLSVVDDQTGSPTYADDLAEVLVRIAETDRYGIYHATSEGVCTWYTFAKEILEQAGKSRRVLPISSDEIGQKARRPHNSRLDKSLLDKEGFGRLPDWKDALKRYLIKRQEE